MKMIISKQDKLKRLVLLQHSALVPEEDEHKSLQKWIQNSKKKPDLEDKEEDEEEEEEKEEEKEEEEIATALDSTGVSHVHVDMDAYDHSKQGLESEIPPQIQNGPESEVTDGCVPSKKALDKTKVSQKNFDIDANDQTKQGPEPEIGTENQQGQESEVIKGGDPKINQATILELKWFLQERVVLMTIVMDLQYYNLILH
jgi:hypothetical protein